MHRDAIDVSFFGLDPRQGIDHVCGTDGHFFSLKECLQDVLWVVALVRLVRIIGGTRCQSDSSCISATDWATGWREVGVRTGG